MRTADKTIKDWAGMYDNPPKLRDTDSWLASLLAVVFLVMAILQVVSFNKFKGALASAGLAGPETWAVVLILAEVWAAAAFLRVRLHGLVRFFSAVFAVFVAGFWFFHSLQAVAGTRTEDIKNSGFFGDYLAQQPGWWTVVEASALLFLTIYILKLSKRR